MDTMQLVDTWEKPLPPRARELLLEELERSGFRIKSLPEPPSYEGIATIAAESSDERNAHSVKVASRWILVIAVLQLLFGTLDGFDGARACTEQLSALEG